MEDTNKAPFAQDSFKSAPFCTDEVTATESFVVHMMQGLQFIQRMAFVTVDCEVDKAIDAHFSKRPMKTKKIYAPAR